MSQHRLPFRADAQWRGGFVLDPPRPVQAVRAARGVVFGAGDRLYLLGQGEQSLRTRDLPSGLVSPCAVAVEPRRKPRLAVCSSDVLTVLDNGRSITVKRGEGSPRFVDLAWGKHEGRFALYVLCDDYTLQRARLEAGDFEEIEIEDVRLLASDEQGTVAFVSGYPEPRVYVSKDGIQWLFRVVPHLGDSARGLAVADEAVAITPDCLEPTFISREKDTEFVACEGLTDAGPLAFEGSHADAPLFAVTLDGPASIVRVAPQESPQLIAEIGSWESEPEVFSLSWDGTRKALWGALGPAGLVRSEAPSPKGKTRPVLS